jgi:ribonuclease BN (tRNA processing enzyme)
MWKRRRPWIGAIQGRRELGDLVDLMKVTIVGSGDAFGTSGRAHTCIRVDAGESSAIVDFGASSICAWKRLGLEFHRIDTIVITHLHGDHFGGLPFLLLDCQFDEHRTKPLTLVGPPGLRQRLDSTFDLLFPGVRKIAWGFDWSVEEIPPRSSYERMGMTVETFEVVHDCAGCATGVRVGDGSKIFAFTGDTAWTTTLYELAAGADLFVSECFSGESPVPNHMDWPTLESRLSGFAARRIVVTHMNKSALSRSAEIESAGLDIAYDGRAFEL